MKQKQTRLDIPGFEYGRKTGEFIDVPKLYGGRPSPKTSGRPHSIEELTRAGGVVSRARKALVLATEIAKEDYSKRKRLRTRRAKAPITNNALPQACDRRFFEYMGNLCGWLDYVEEPELFVSRAKTAYEVTDGFLPMVTVTSAREALIICATLARHGIAAYFNKVTIRRN